ncbi:hypothetical protein [Bacillus cereus]|uniref:hypothetical protein n=2 Tax=Bacillus TaxID=1386 RepID=UPI001D1133C4|nr:hypothetical protein [Bacillus cereus]UDW09207.1 hypothetical protein FHP23_029210 [Bacillus cereus]
MKNEKIQFEVHNYKPDDGKTIGLSPSTINTRLKTLRVMFCFLVDKELIERNPMKQIKNVNEPQEEIAVLTVHDIDFSIVTTPIVIEFFFLCINPTPELLRNVNFKKASKLLIRIS